MLQKRRRFSLYEGARLNRYDIVVEGAEADMRRREFLGVFGGAAAAWPLAARAQQPALPVVGFLRSTSAASSTNLVAAFREGLVEAGFIEGQNVRIEYRWADDQDDRLRGMAADLVRRRVSVIVGNTPSTRAAMAATATVPIVFVLGSDPVRAGLVASINRPGGNVTGVVFTTGDLTAKRLGLLHELVPNAAVIGVLLEPTYAEFDFIMKEAEAAGRTIGRKIFVVKAASEREFDAAFATIVQAGVGALLVGGGPYFNNRRRQLAALAGRHALPASYVNRGYVEVGGLMSYGPSQTDAYRRAGIYAGRILNGAKPADMPVELATKFELVINLATAKALGLTVPSSMQLLADEVIE
jgi:putative ABC transport system substrate-binding protein